MGIAMKEPALIPRPAAAGDAKAIIDAMELLGGFDLQHINALAPRQGDVPVALVPVGKDLRSVKELLDEYAIAPDRITGTATLRDEASFVQHVNEQKRAHTRIFCEPKNVPPTFTAVYDYHALVDGTPLPAFREHRAIWPLTMSKEWAAWTGQAGKAMPPQEFAEFLERHVPDVYWGDQMSDYTKLLISSLELRLASPSSLIALSRNLAVNLDTQVRHAQTLSSGEIAITYIETHRDGEGQPIKVPNAFLIAIPVVQGGPLYQILARLAYRVRDGKVTWSYTLHRTDLVFDEALKEIRARIEEATERTVFLGSPEV